MIMITVGSDYPRLGSSLLALGKPLAPFGSLGLGEGATWRGATAPSLTVPKMEKNNPHEPSQ